MEKSQRGIKMDIGRAARAKLLEKLMSGREFCAEITHTEKRHGINAITLRQESLRTRPENFLIAIKVSRIVAGLPIAKRYDKYGTPIVPANQNNIKTKLFNKMKRIWRKPESVPSRLDVKNCAATGSALNNQIFFCFHILSHARCIKANISDITRPKMTKGFLPLHDTLRDLLSVPQQRLDHFLRPSLCIYAQDRFCT